MELCLFFIHIISFNFCFLVYHLCFEKSIFDEKKDEFCFHLYIFSCWLFPSILTPPVASTVLVAISFIWLYALSNLSWSSLLLSVTFFISSFSDSILSDYLSIVFWKSFFRISTWTTHYLKLKGLRENYFKFVFFCQFVFLLFFSS